MTEEQKLYTTGQFAELCGVKKQTLFHYDDIDLLKPAYVEDNGYRRYSHEQYQTFMLISCLKEAGMSLAEIKDYLDLDDVNLRRQIMTMRINALDQRISYLMNVRKILSAFFAQDGTAPGDDEHDDEIRLENRPVETVWALGPLDKLDDKELVERVALLVKHVEPSSVALSSSDVIAGTYDNQQYLLVKGNMSVADADMLHLSPFTCPEGRYAVTSQQSGEEPEDAYRRLLASLDAFEEDPGEFFYEEYPTLLDNGNESPMSIAVQIIPRDPNDGRFH